MNRLLHFQGRFNQQMGAEISNCSKKNNMDVIHPSNEQYRSATKAEQEQWLRHILSQGKTAPPIETAKNKINQHDRGYHTSDIRDFKRAYESYKQFQMAQQVVDIMVNQQQKYLCTGNWLDRNKLTFQQIAQAIGLYSEPTVRRAIKSLNLKLNGNIFPASSLLCSSMRPSVCKQVLKLSKQLPHLGAPALTDILNHETGIKVSQRYVGLALDKLREDALL